jgi:hypothetical protein
MRLIYKLSFTVILAVTAFAIIQTAQAGSIASARTCSDVFIAGPSGGRQFAVWNNGFTSPQCDGGGTGVAPVDIEAGKSITLHCLETSSGVAPPGTPDANGIVIRGYADNNGFPDGAGQIWTQTYSSCITQQDFTIFCTSDGTSTGSPRWGIVRLLIRATDTSLPTTYNDDSDDASTGTNDGRYGIYRCNPHPESVTNHKGSLGASPSTYEGGNTIFSNWTTNASTINTGNTYSNRLKCINSVEVGTGFQVTQASTSTTSPATGAVTVTQARFPPNCYLWQNLSITRTSAITGWTAVRFGIWQTGTGLPSGVVIQNSSGDLEINTTKQVRYDWSWTGINMTKTDSDAAANVSSFTISADQEFARAKGLKNATGVLVSGATATCRRTTPQGTQEAIISHGTTDANGDSTRVSYAVSSPAGNWIMTCTATLNENTATYSVTFAHASAFTANTGIGINWNVTTNITPGLYDVNITMVLRLFDPFTGILVQAFPDMTPKLSVLSYNHTQDLYNDVPVNAQTMQLLDGGMATAWHYNFTANQSNLTGAVAYVTFNLTGNPFLGSQGYHLNWTPPSTAASIDTSQFEGAAHANQTWESQPHVNSTYCKLGTATDACVSNGYANITFASTGSVPILPPDSVTIPALIMFLSLAGAAFGFAFINPWARLLGAMTQLVCVWITLSNSSQFAGGFQNFLEVTLLLLFGSMLILLWKIYTDFSETRAKRDEEGDIIDG